MGKFYKIRKTGEVVEVIAHSSTLGMRDEDKDYVSYIDSSGKEHFYEKLNLYWDMIEVEGDSNYWFEFRNNASVQIMQAILETDTTILKSIISEAFDILPKRCIRLADELVKELKNKEKDS